MRATGPSPSGARNDRRVPPRALALSILALVVPVVAALVRPEWLERDGALLVWIPLLLPAFLLTFYRGWTGASLALAGGMAALAFSQAAVLGLNLFDPRWGLLLPMVAVLVAVAAGAGWLGEHLDRARREVEQSALKDPLTDLPNRRQAIHFLESSWTGASGGSPLSVVVFDLDGFKKVNARIGHDAADQLVVAFSSLLSAHTPASALSARLGGTRFATVLTDTTVDEAVRFAEGVRAALTSLDAGGEPVTVSAGVGTLEEGMGGPAVLFAAADRALGAAKELGRNRVQRGDAPLSMPPRTEDQGAGRAPVRTGAPRVLIVDDDPDALRSTARLVEATGAETLKAVSAREALEILIARDDLDLLVTDIIMPEMSGFTLVELAGRVRPRLPILYMSGYPAEEVYWGGTPGSLHAFLSKPFELDDLRSAIASLLPPSADAPSEDDDEEGEEEAARPTVAAPTPSGAPAPSAGDAPATRKGRILVVDDDRAVADSLRRVFRRAGYALPIVLNDPRLVTDLVLAGGVDIILLDLHMPGMSGLDVMRELRAAMDRDEYLPILCMTGDVDPGVRREVLAAGAMDFLAKPLDPAETQARVSNLLATRWLHQRVAQQRDALEERVRSRTAELADARTEILHRLARAAEYRDDVTGRHAERVGLLASLVAAELGAGSRQVDMIRRTGPLHDIGKIGVPDAILRKPGPLTTSEFELMKAHTTIGAQILGESRHEILRVANRIALCHHEKWDGSGYPRGLAGEDIPLEARVVTVADVFDTLTHLRPYREPCSPERALEIIVGDSGTHFDPEAVSALQSIFARTPADRLMALADPLERRRDAAG